MSFSFDNNPFVLFLADGICASIENGPSLTLNMTYDYETGRQETIDIVRGGMEDAHISKTLGAYVFPAEDTASPYSFLLDGQAYRIDIPALADRLKNADQECNAHEGPVKMTFSTVKEDGTPVPCTGNTVWSYSPEAIQSHYLNAAYKAADRLMLGLDNKLPMYSVKLTERNKDGDIEYWDRRRQIGTSEKEVRAAIEDMLYGD